MKMLSKLILIVLSYTVFTSSTSYATEVLEIGEGAVHSQRPWSQFDLKLAKEYIEEEKKEARKIGVEKGIEIGRIEEAKAAALRMLEKGFQEDVIAEITTILSPQQILELKESLNQ